MSQTLAPVRETAFSPVSLRRGFVANARSEWTKLRTVRSTIWALVLTVIFTVGLGALFTGIEVSRWDHRTLTEIKGFDPLLYSFAGLNLAQLSIGVLGVLVMTSEYSTRTIKLTFAAAPQRTLLLGAKVATFSAVVAVVGLISCFAAFWVCQALLAPEHAGLSISGPGVLFAVLLIVPGLVTLLPSPWNNDITRYLPSSAGAAMSAVARFPSLLSPGGGLIVLCAYAAAALLLAALADLITAPDLTATRAITIHAPADLSWPWIAQLGQGRGGFYSYDWLENLLGLDIHSADRVVSEWQHIQAGDQIRLAADVGLTVTIAEPGRALVIRGGIPIGAVPCPYVFTWGWILREQPDGTTRLVVRERYAYIRRWAPYLLEPVQLISFVMTRRMLRGIKERAERSASPAVPLTAGQTYAGPACQW